ncbi:ribonuclease H-like domain-containing protein [Tanacetum coccineum]
MLLIAQIDEDHNISLVHDKGTSWFPQDEEVHEEAHEKTSVDTEVLVQEETPTEIIEDLRSGEKGEKEVSTAKILVSTVSPPRVPTTELGTASPRIGTAAEILLSMDEELARNSQEEDQARAIVEQEQERINLEAALELSKKLNVKEGDAAEPTQTHEIDWNDPSVLRYHALKNRAYSVAEVRRNMIMYLKNQAGYKQSYFKGMTYEDIRPIFKKVWDQVNTFVPMESEIQKGTLTPVDEEKVEKEDVKPEVKQSPKKSGRKRKKSLARKRARETEVEESSKKQKHEDDAEKEELGLSLKIVLDEDKEINYEVLDMKYPIVDWESQVLRNVKDREYHVYKITRADGKSKFYSNFTRMLDTFDRDGVLKLHSLVMERFPNNDPVSCGVHTLIVDGTLMTIHICVEKKYRLTKDTLKKMLNWRLEVDAESNMAFELLNTASVFLVLLEDVIAAEVLKKDTIDLGLGSTSGIRACALRNFNLEVMEFESAQNPTTAKLPILKLGEYEMWEIRIKQYFQVQDYALWEVIENEDLKKNDVKARSLLLMAIPNEHNLHSASMMMLKQWLLPLKHDLEEDLNSKFLRCLPPEWNTHVVVWINKAEIESMSIDDLYNNFKIIEHDVKKSVGPSNGNQILAFMTTPSTGNTIDVSTANTVSIGSTNVNTASPQTSTTSISDNIVYAFMVENPNGSNLLHQDLEQIHEDDLEAMDLKWQLSLLSMRAKRYFQRTGKKIFINGNNTAWFDKTKVECFNCHRLGQFSRECRLPRNKDGQFRYQDNTRKQRSNEDTSSKAMLAIDGVGFDWSDMAEEQTQNNMALMAFSDSEVHNDKSYSKTCLKNYETLKKQCDNLLVKLNETEFKASTYKRGLATVEEQLLTYKKNEVLFSEEVVVLKREKFDDASKSLDKMLGSQITDKSKKGLGYSVVPPPHPLIYNIPTKLDLSYSDLDEFKEPEFQGYGPKDDKQESKTICDVELVNSEENTEDSLVKEQVLEDDSTSDESTPKFDTKTIFHTNKKVESVKPKNDEKPVKRSVRYAEMYRSQRPRGNQRNWNGQKPRVINTARPYTVPDNTVRAYGVNVVKTSACWVWRPTRPNGASLGKPKMYEKGFVDSGCSRHMIGNIAHLLDFQEFDEGYVTFGGGAYGGRITRKGTLKTDNIDFKDVYFVNELKFNLFSVSQMCDKKNYVLFTDSECLVLSPDFKLLDENQILLKIPRKDNMYSFDMKCIVPKDGLTCLVTQALLDESMLWHRRLGHVNFKNINKLVKEKLVRGLPFRRFENDQTCVACLKGK